MAVDRRQGATAAVNFVALVRRRWVVVVAAAVVVPAVVLGFSFAQTAQYSSTAEVLLSRQNLGSSLTGTQDPALFTQSDRLTQTQADVARVPDVASRVVDELRLKETPDGFLARSSVGQKSNSDVLQFTVTNADPRSAVREATAYAHAYTSFRRSLDTASLESTREGVESRLRELEASGSSGKSSALYRSLLAKAEQLKTLEALQTANASVVREATVAEQVAPRPVRNGVLALLLGVALGLSLAYLRESLETRVRSSEEVEAELQTVLLARLVAPPKDVAASNQLVMLTDPASPQAEGFRVLRMNLEFASLGASGARLMVTSASEREGKSTTICNLAVAYARAGKRVILVDLDLRRPSVGRFFDLVGAPGITEVALGLADLDDAVRDVQLDRSGGTLEDDRSHSPLRVIGAGISPPDPGEFVATDVVGEILDRLADQCDVLLIDAPPLLPVGDGLAIASRVDGVFVVTRLDIVKRASLRELARKLALLRCRTVGFVLTGALPTDQYGYGYGYGGEPGAASISGAVAPPGGQKAGV